MASEEKKIGCRRMGPGGMNCPCCGPAPGKKRRAFQRVVKRYVRQLWRKRIRRILEEF